MGAGIGPTPEVAETLREIFGRAAEYREIGGLVRSVGESPSTVHRWVQADGLLSPGNGSPWRALRAALRLQREQWTALLMVATGLRYGDHSAPSRRAVQLFGFRRGEAIRRPPGSERLLERWLGGRLASGASGE